MLWSWDELNEQRTTLYGKGYGISAILAIFGPKYGVVFAVQPWYGKVFSRSHFFIVIEKEINKSPSQIMFTVMSKGTNYNAGLNNG